jgi:hypothetical protein
MTWQCPLWVKSGHVQRKKGMSDLTPKADICGAAGHVRLVPKAHIRPQDNAGGKSSGDNPGFEGAEV